jgi:hypothetical protein
MNSLADVNALLEQWKERGFNQTPVRKPRATGVTGASLKVKRHAWASNAGGVRAHLGHIARRTPQVMVRISGGGRGMRHIRAHLDYITRNGKLVAIDQNEERHQGRDELNDLGHELQYGGFPIAEKSDRREAFNIILSMPKGTDSAGVLRAAARFAADEFERHQYALVLHDYATDPHKDPARHPHVHLCVKAMGEDGVRLNPRKQDLQRWRERFAQRLREHGIDAAASSRLERLQRQRGQKQSVLHKRARGESTQLIGTTPVDGARRVRAQRIEETMRQRYSELLQILGRSPDQGDRLLAAALGSRHEVGHTEGARKPVERDRGHDEERFK